VGRPWRAWRVALSDRRGRWGAGTSAEPAHGHTSRSRTVGKRLAGCEDRHALWTPPIRSERAVTNGAGLWGVHRPAAKGARRRALDAAAWPWARVWEGARGRDLVALSVVVAGAGVAGRPPAGSRGLPPHGPASRQRAWVSDWSSVPRRSAWRPDHTWGTPPTPWPCPSASAARNSRSRRSDTRRWPHNPPGVRRSEASGPEACSMPAHPHRQGCRPVLPASRPSRLSGLTSRRGSWVARRLASGSRAAW
jgi:hypothetical protein